MKNLLVMLILLLGSSVMHAMTAGELKQKCKADESFCTGYISGALDSLATTPKIFTRNSKGTLCKPAKSFGLKF